MLLEKGKLGEEGLFCILREVVRRKQRKRLGKRRRSIGRASLLEVEEIIARNNKVRVGNGSQLWLT